ncbi:hypothetical protein B4086_5769 [Bacillus cereus]|nr:hypothetical protein B4086_5769 [Bacillus cereus]
MGVIKTVRAVDAVVVMIEGLETGKWYLRREIEKVLRERFPFITKDQLSHAVYEASVNKHIILDRDVQLGSYNRYKLSEEKVYAFLLQRAKETPVPIENVKHELERIVSYVSGLSVLDVGNKGTYDWLQSIGDKAKNTLDSFESINF